MLTLALRPTLGMSPPNFAHLSRYVVIDGVPTSPLRLLEPGESDTVQISICLLAEGRYEFGCVVEEMRELVVGQPRRDELDDEEPPRRYQAREPLIIEVA